MFNKQQQEESHMSNMVPVGQFPISGKAQVSAEKPGSNGESLRRRIARAAIQNAQDKAYHERALAFLRKSMPNWKFEGSI